MVKKKLCTKAVPAPYLLKASPSTNYISACDISVYAIMMLPSNKNRKIMDTNFNVAASPFQPYQLNMFTSCIYRCKLNFASDTLKTLGVVLISAGVGFAALSRTIQNLKLSTPIVVITALVINFLGLAALYAGRQVDKVNDYIVKLHQAIKVVEDSGDYDKALELTRHGINESERFKLNTEVLNKLVIEYQEKILSKGFLDRLFDSQYKPRASLIKFLELAGMPNLNSNQEAIVQIKEWTQANFLRPKEKERWEVHDTRFDLLRDKLKPFLTELGFLNEVEPHIKDYKGALIQGALIVRVRLRLYHLIELWKKGYRFNNTIYFFTGDRALFPEFENRETFTKQQDTPLKIRKDWTPPDNLPTTEKEMIEWVWNQSEMPEEFRRNMAPVYVTAPLKLDPELQKMVRPTANDCALYWSQSFPAKGKYLYISNSPYIHRFDLVMRNLFDSDKELQFDSVGPRASDKEKMSTIIDEVGRAIFEMWQMYEKHKQYVVR